MLFNSGNGKCGTRNACKNISREKICSGCAGDVKMGRSVAGSFSGWGQVGEEIS